MYAWRLIASAFLAVFLFSAPGCTDQMAPADPHDPVTPAVPVGPSLLAARQVAAHENAFGFDLLRTLDRDSGAENTFVSPLSIDQAVSMLAAGAGGQTLTEIDRTLHAGNAAPDALSQAAALRDDLLAQIGGTNSSAEMTIANALWANHGITLRPAYVDACLHQLGARTSTLDFRDSAASRTINQWVATQTRGKIKEIVQQSELKNESAVLTDAVYFHGHWSSPFDLSDTESAKFHSASGATVTLPMMTQTEFFPAVQTKAFQAVALPYERSGLSMVVVLPRAGNSLDVLARSLTPATWHSITSSLHGQPVQLFLPRFHIDYSTDLVRCLNSLGMRRVFGGGVDLSPMSSKPLYVNDVIHKTTLDVDEKGTVATAVTAIGVQASAVEMPQQLLTIRVDHPFVCAIRDDATGALLFLGCVRDPQPIK